MEVFSLLTLAALVIKIVSVIKAIGKNNNLVLTQVVVWVVGIGVLLLAANSGLTAGISIFTGAPPLGDLDIGSVVLAGLALGSTGSFAYDYKKARDNADSAVEPALVPGAVGP